MINNKYKVDDKVYFLEYSTGGFWFRKGNVLEIKQTKWGLDYLIEKTNELKFECIEELIIGLVNEEKRFYNHLKESEFEKSIRDLINTSSDEIKKYTKERNSKLTNDIKKFLEEKNATKHLND